MIFNYFDKSIILYEDHRITNPIWKNSDCININLKYILFTSKLFRKLTFNKFGKVYYWVLIKVLNLINPDAILSVNWTTEWQKIYYIWSKKKQKKFIVIQHGVYWGGYIRLDHRYMKCDKFLVWGVYFKKVFSKYNNSRKNDIIIFGNPIYNNEDRSKFSYAKSKSQKIITPQHIKDSELEVYQNFIQKLINNFEDLHIKYHNFQKNKPNIKGLVEVSGNFYQLINNYNVVIADNSTSLLDSIFYKKYIIYFNPKKIDTIYKEYLSVVKIGSKGKLENKINKKNQENLLSYLVSKGDNNILDVF